MAKLRHHEMAFLIGILYLVGVSIARAQTTSATRQPQTSSASAIGANVTNASETSPPRTPKILIQGKWGAGPGQFGYRLLEGEMAAPTELAVGVDDKIYILDQFNNRMAGYDGNGKLLGEIPLPTNNPEFLDQPTLLSRLRFYKNSLYLFQTVPGSGNQRLLMLRDNEFNLITVDTDSLKIIAVINPGPKIRAEELRSTLHNDPHFHILSRTIRDPHGKTFDYAEPTYAGTEIADFSRDALGNNWIIGDGEVKEFSPKGSLIFEVATHNGTATVSPNGNLYLMSIASLEPNIPSDQVDYEQFGCLEVEEYPAPK